MYYMNDTDLNRFHFFKKVTISYLSIGLNICKIELNEIVIIFLFFMAHEWKITNKVCKHYSFIIKQINRKKHSIMSI